MKITRAWAIPNKWTFTIKPIKELLDRHFTGSANWADPFCGQSKIAKFRNDLNPQNPNAKSHLMAHEFLEIFEDESLDGVLFDPPYSPRQMSECYKGIGLKVNGEMTRSGWPKEKDQMARVLKIGGKVIYFGWNSNGLGKTRGFEIIEILMVAHGGGSYDTLCTVETKIQKFVKAISKKDF